MAKTGQKQVIFQKTSFWPVFANLDHYIYIWESDVRNGKNWAETGFFPK
jgi:hypothetical protein